MLIERSEETRGEKFGIFGSFSTSKKCIEKVALWKIIGGKRTGIENI